MGGKTSTSLATCASPRATGAAHGPWPHDRPGLRAERTVAPTKPTSGEVKRRDRQPITFDAGAGSDDDASAPSKLGYAWDFDGDGTFDRTGVSVKHKYTIEGTYNAVLEVTDKHGRTSTATKVITVKRGN